MIIARASSVLLPPRLFSGKSLRPRRLSSTPPLHIRAATLETLVTPESGPSQDASSSPPPSPSSFYFCETKSNPSDTPATRDAARFTLDPSVPLWRDWRDEFSTYITKNDFAGMARALVDKLQKAGAFSTPTGVAYYSYHLLRSSFFTINGTLGALLSGTQAASRFTGTTPSETLQRLSLVAAESIDAFQQDYQHIEAGYYKLPWDMTTPFHRQFNPLYVLSKTVRFVNEARSTLSRSEERTPDKIWLYAPDLLPEYYKTFHYQSDGWLSSRSAKVYEMSTETLFTGRQDAMQRLALVPLADHLRTCNLLTSKVLEIGCGTGRFHTYLRDEYPALNSTALDLSPYYLEEARSNYEYWKRMRCPEGKDPGNTDFILANAEKIPLPDASMDAVVSVYLFHELPPQARMAVFREVSRVLKPGGVFILNDSIQWGDRGDEVDKKIALFGNFNEPHYVGHLQTDYGLMGEKEGGFRAGRKWVMSRSKVLEFFKPE